MANVLVVGGFGGNELRAKFPVYQGSITVWLCVKTLRVGGYHWLQLASDGQQKYLPWYPRLNPGPLVQYFYPTLTNSLRSQGWDVVDHWTDWRMPLDDQAAALVDQIYDLSAQQPVRIVCHSRGGLLTARALQTIWNAGNIKRVWKCVGLGVPWAGSYAPIPYLGGWINQYLEDLNLSAGFGSMFALRVPLAHLRFIVASWPSIYELLPNPAVAAQAGDTLVPALYDPTTWENEGVPVNALHLENARKAWDGFVGLPPGVDWLDIIGVGLGARGPMRNAVTVGKSGLLGHDFEGDGVVPEFSARASGKRAIAIAESHSGLLSSDLAHGIIRSHLA